MKRYILKYDLAKMNPSFSTSLQSWSRSKLLTITLVLLVLHGLAFFLGVFMAPNMFHESKVPGTVCVWTSSADAAVNNTWYKETASEATRCVPMESSSLPKVDSLDQSLLAFRFPTDQTKPSYYSRWNWRLIGSLYIRLSIAEEIILLEEEENDEEFETSSNGGNNVTENFFREINRPVNVPVTMDAKLDASSQNIVTSYDENTVTTTNEHFRDFEWIRQSEIIADRKLQCTVSSIQADEQLGDGLESNLDYSCTLTPLFSIELLSNQSYILQLNFSPPRKNISLADDSIFSTMSSKPALIKEISLTVIVEDDNFHAALFYLKCLCVPFVLGALIMFCIRLYLNDLYVSIPDRLLITCALAQTLHNVPVEALIAEGNMWDASPYIKLLDDLSKFILVSSLFLFWLIYTKDKISTKEPWERNTRYYWRQIAVVILSGLIAALWVVYGRGPGFRNAFKNHWLVDTPSVMVSLGLIFSLAALALAYQTYLSVLVFRALCDISVVHYRQHYCSASGRSYIPHRIWRIKMVLLYSFFVSVLTIGGLILQLAMELSLHWNPQFYLNPIPFHLTFASAYMLGLNGMWNLHVMTLLIMLARNTKSGGSFQEDYVRPVTYTCRSLDDDNDHETEEDNNDNNVLLDSLTHYSSDHQGQRPDSNLKRRQSSEDFLEMQAAREFQQYCMEHPDLMYNQHPRYDHDHYSQHQYHFDDHHVHHHHHDSHVTNRFHDEGNSSRYDDFSSSPDPFEEEAMVDDEDPLEIARQGTVHIWEDENVIICHGGSEGQCDAFLATAAAVATAASVGSEELYER